MKTYQVVVTATFDIYVNAESKQDAKDLAEVRAARILDGSEQSLIDARQCLGFIRSVSAGKAGVVE